MKMKLLFLIICCQALFAQGEGKNARDMPYASTAPDRSKRVVKVVHVKGNAEGIAALAGRASGVNYEASTTLKAIVLRGEPADVANVERTIEELDNPNREGAAASAVPNIELTIYVIAGSSEPLAGFEEVTGDALGPVLKQLRAIFPYKHYQLLTTVLTRSAQNSNGRVDGVIRPIEMTDLNLGPVTYQLSYESVGVSTEANPLIHVLKLQFGAGLPVVIGPKESKQFQTFRIGISSNLDVREGQKVVVGSSNVPEGNTSVFLVLSARLVQ